jgi:hypothetical protein
MTLTNRRPEPAVQHKIRIALAIVALGLVVAGLGITAFPVIGEEIPTFSGTRPGTIAMAADQVVGLPVPPFIA